MFDVSDAAAAVGTQVSSYARDMLLVVASCVTVVAVLVLLCLHFLSRSDVYRRRHT